MSIAFRSIEPRDRPFVISTWETSYRRAHTSGAIPMVLWADIMRGVVEHYVDRPHTLTIVAHNPDDPDPIADLYGFICCEPDEHPPIVYYVYVKEAYRKQGIARSLFHAAGIKPTGRFEYLCSTPVVPYLQTKIPLAAWRPVRARYSKEERNHAR